MLRVGESMKEFVVGEVLLLKDDCEKGCLLLRWWGLGSYSLCLKCSLLFYVNKFEEMRGASNLEVVLETGNTIFLKLDPGGSKVGEESILISGVLVDELFERRL